MSGLATTTVIGTTYFALVIAAMHFIRLDINPIERPTSEYAVGPFGYLMTSAFLSLSVGTWALVLGLRRDLPHRGHFASASRFLHSRVSDFWWRPRFRSTRKAHSRRSQDDSWNQRPADLPEPDDGNESRVARVQVRSEMAPDLSIRPDARAPDDSRVCGWWCREGSRIGSGTCIATSHFHVRDLVSSRRFSTPLSCGPSQQSSLKHPSANRPVSESTFSESHKRLGDEPFGLRGSSAGLT